MNQLTPYGQSIAARYRALKPYFNRVLIPFDSFSSANATTPTLDLEECTDDLLICEFSVDFENALVKVIVKDNTQYDWMLNDLPCPVHTVAGAATQVTPNLPLPIEYYLPGNSKLQFQFTNASTGMETVVRYISCRGLRLKDRIQTK